MSTDWYIFFNHRKPIFEGALAEMLNSGWKTRLAKLSPKLVYDDWTF